ncbi:hypothetical protein AVEN_137065-1 [Araneus ventricosus]|uniref:Uncharacterized protein n=1 Tax=Araneus ventricosus TaxID=182803 RepID=A0A4Y2XBS0_ARAVE|nr:hypothetical protein AVEN_137065-1 [Araneus ventricosus]
MHGQCPDSWCKFQRAVSRGIKYSGNEKGLPKAVMKIVQPVYMKLCDQELLKKCLHGKTQNANESFNCILWKFIPKEIFVELQTLRFWRIYGSDTVQQRL